MTTSGSPFRVEVFNDHSEPLVKPFTTGIAGFDTEPVALPAGDCNVVLSAPGARSETARLLVQRGQKYRFQFAPELRRLWGSLPIKPDNSAEVLDLGGRADLILVEANPATARIEVRLEVSDATCAECVLPGPLLEQVIADTITRHSPGEFELVLRDPRAAGASGH